MPYSRYKYIAVITVFFSLLFLIWGLFLGPVSIPIHHLLSPTHTESLILFQIRLPQLLTAFVVGACLASAGATYQGILQNPLADPFILGVSAGAGLGVALGVQFGNPLWLPLFAFIGAVLTIFLLVMLIQLMKYPSILHFILVGVIINAFLSAFMMLVLFFSKHEFLSIVHWLMGDLTKTHYPTLAGVYIASFIFLGWILRFSHTLNILALGDSQAISLGARPAKIRAYLLIAASGLCGLSVACAGMIGFVGLIVPHALRLIVKDDFRFLIPTSFLVGGAFLLLVHCLSRTLLTHIEFPIGVLTALIGAPIFIILLLKTYSK